MTILGATTWRGPRLLTLQDRVLMGSCVRHVAIVLVMLTSIAVALDTASWITRVGAAAQDRGASAILSVLRFIGLRALDNGTQTFPIAAILGFIWTEVAYHQTGHRLVDRITGRTEWRAMRSILLAGAMVAACQTLVDNVVRPYAVQTMITERLAFWTRYTQSSPSRPQWLSTGETILSGTLERVGSPVLQDVTAFVFDGNRIARLIRADSLTPAGTLDRDGLPQWRLTHSTVASLGEAATGEARGARRGTPTSFVDLTIPLALDPDWLALSPVKPVYLTLSQLTRMARIEHVPDGSANYVSSLMIRLSGGTVVGLLCIFIALFCRRGLERCNMVAAVLSSLAIGYGGLLAMRMLRVIGEYTTYVPLAVAGVAPVVLAVLIVAIVRASTRHDREGCRVPREQRRGADR